MFQTVVDFLLRPEEALPVLDPFQVGDGHTASVAQDVGDDHYALGAQDVVCIRGGGAVGAFGNHPGLDVGGIGAGDLVLQRGGDQHVAIDGQELLVGDRLAAGVAFDQVGILAGIGQHVTGVKSIRVVQAAAHVADGDDPGALILQQISRDRTDVAEALHSHPRALDRDIQVLERPDNGMHHAATGGFVAAQRPAQRDGLAGDYAGRGGALDHGISVHDPGHRLCAGVHVGGGDVVIRPNDRG